MHRSPLARRSSTGYEPSCSVISLINALLTVTTWWRRTKLTFSHKPCRVTPVDFKRWNGSVDYAAEGNHGVLAYGRARSDCSLGADPATIPEHYGPHNQSESWIRPVVITRANVYSL